MRSNLFNILLRLLLCLSCSSALANELRIEPITPLPTPSIDNPALAELGEQLFHDPRLSSDNTTSCASCHRLEQGGVDNLTKSIGAHGRQSILNTPTVFNSSLYIKQFWDGRANNLREQIDFPIHSTVEMDNNWPTVINTLNKDSNYQHQFKHLFADDITVDNIKTAIVYFEQSLITPNSRFDQYLKGNDSAITEAELTGYTLFKEYGCIACHQGIAVGGNMFQKLGIMKDYFVGTISPEDLGRFNLTKDERDKFVFKVPSLRNIALTAPYLHDGVIATLDETVKVMMIYQLGVDNPPDKDIQLIVQFLKTLTGEYNGVPL